MRAIYKYNLKMPFDRISLPVGSKILCTHQQHSHVTIWVDQDIDDNEVETEFLFHIVPTGGNPPDDMTYCGTCFIEPFVWHVYYTK